MNTTKPEVYLGATAGSMQQKSDVLEGKRFVKTGEYRTPKKGDIFLSAWREPVAVLAESDFCQDQFHILREVAEACGMCAAGPMNHCFGRMEGCVCACGSPGFGEGG